MKFYLLTLFFFLVTSQGYAQGFVFTLNNGDEVSFDFSDNPKLIPYYNRLEVISKDQTSTYQYGNVSFVEISKATTAIGLKNNTKNKWQITVSEDKVLFAGLDNVGYARLFSTEGILLGQKKVRKSSVEFPLYLMKGKVVLFETHGVSTKIYLK